MAVIGGRPPERGPKNHWATGQPAAGKHYLAWVAGPAVYVEAHMGPRTKCCTKEYRGADSLCEGCRFTLRRSAVWYLPLWREIDDAGVVVLVHENQLATLESLRTHQQVRVGRGSRQSDGVWVAPTTGPMYDTGSPDRQGEVDICDWLPVLWKLKGIITGDMIRRGPLCAAADAVAAPPAPPAPPARLEPEAETKLATDLISEAFGLETNGTADEARKKRNERFVRDVRERNGKH